MLIRNGRPKAWCMPCAAEYLRTWRVKGPRRPPGSPRIAAPKPCWAEPLGCRERATLAVLLVSGPHKVKRHSCAKHLGWLRGPVDGLGVKVSVEKLILTETLCA